MFFGMPVAATAAYFGSVVEQSSWARRPPRSPIVTWAGTSTDGSIYRGNEGHCRFDGAEVVVTVSRPRTVTLTGPALSGCCSMRLR
jgi:hypothetical protein